MEICWCGKNGVVLFGTVYPRAEKKCAGKGIGMRWRLRMLMECDLLAG